MYTVLEVAMADNWLVLHLRLVNSQKKRSKNYTDGKTTVCNKFSSFYT